jgi:hypothetical protein
MSHSLPPIDMPSLEPSLAISSPAEALDLVTLASMCGELAKPAPDGGKFNWRHRVASFLHGWETHEYHQNCKVVMTLDDYKAALAAVDTQTTHAPAVREADKA